MTFRTPAAWCKEWPPGSAASAGKLKRGSGLIDLRVRDPISRRCFGRNFGLCR